MPAVTPLVLFVNFHHVRPANPTWCPGLPFVEVAAFERQVDLLSARFDFPHPDRVLRLLSERDGAPSRPLCVLTFDDGLADHPAYVGPILAARGISGVSNVSTGSWRSRRLLSVHQAHLLAGAFSYRALAQEFEEAAHASGCSAPTGRRRSHCRREPVSLR